MLSCLFHHFPIIHFPCPLFLFPPFSYNNNLSHLNASLPVTLSPFLLSSASNYISFQCFSRSSNLFASYCPIFRFWFRSLPAYLYKPFFISFISLFSSSLPLLAFPNTVNTNGAVLSFTPAFPFTLHLFRNFRP